MPDWQIDIDWHGLPSLISSCQCSANPPMQDQSDANRDPHLDWRCPVNPRNSRPILCNAYANSAPIEAQTIRLSVANSMSIGHHSAANPMSIQCQRLDRHASLWGQCAANPMSILCQSIANPLPILCQPAQPIFCQSSINQMPIHRQSIANPLSASSADPSSFLRQSSANLVTICCQSFANRVPIWCQSIANSVPI